MTSRPVEYGDFLDFETIDVDRVLVKFRTDKGAPWQTKEFNAYDALSLANRLRTDALMAVPGGMVTLSAEERERAKF